MAEDALAVAHLEISRLKTELRIQTELFAKSRHALQRYTEICASDHPQDEARIAAMREIVGLLMSRRSAVGLREMVALDLAVLDALERLEALQ